MSQPSRDDVIAHEKRERATDELRGIVVTIRMPRYTREALRKLAKQQGVTLQQLCLDALYALLTTETRSPSELESDEDARERV